MAILELKIVTVGPELGYFILRLSSNFAVKHKVKMEKKNREFF